MSAHADRTPVTPGVATELAVHVTNDAGVPCAYRIRALGAGEPTGPVAYLTPVLQPGESVTIGVPVLLPTGFPACDHLAAIESTPVDPADGSTPLGAPVVREVVLAVGDLEVLRAQLDPADARGGGRGRTHVSLWNRTRDPISVGLSSQSPDGKVRATFASPDLTLAPGELARIRTRLRGPRPFAGSARRTPFTVTVQGHTTPVHLEGSFTQSPVLSRGPLRIVAILAVIALWAGALAVGVDRWADRGGDEDERAATAAAAGDGGADGSDGDGSSDGSGGGDGSGSDGDGDGEDGEGGPLQARVGGKVEAGEPGGVSVTIEPVSLVDEAAQDATFASLSRRPPGVAKRLGPRAAALQNRVVSERRQTATDTDGNWAFAGVRTPGFFLVSFAKAGYGSQSFIVETTEDGAPVNLDATLEAGDGALRGTIRGPDGAGLGGVDVTVSDGTIELATRTPTSGDVGSWSVEGLGTPGTFLVTASRRGFGTETTLVDLSGGASQGGVDLTLQPGVAAITGTVGSPEGELGNVTVTATDGDVTRTATTLTEGAVGTYTLPQLPIPGVYTLTFEADGWLTETRRIELTDNESADADLVRATATVYGSITDDTGSPVDGVGITATNGELTVKNTSVGDPEPGAYELAGLVPGTYVVTFERFEYEVATAVVEVAPGTLHRVDVTLTARDPAAAVPETSIVSGVVLDGVTGQAVRGVTVEVTIPDVPGASTTVNPAGDFEIGGLPAGIHTLVFTATGYETVERRARVGVGERATVDVALQPLASFQGTVFSRADNSTLPGITVDLEAQAGTQTPPLSLSAVTDSFGAFAFTRVLPTGSYLVTFSSDDVAPGTEDPYRELQFPLVIDAGSTVTEEIFLDRYPQLLLHTQQPNAVAGAASPFVDLTGVTVTIRPVTPGASPERTFVMQDEHGTAVARRTVVGLLPGTYELLFEKSGYVSAQSSTVDLGLNANVQHRTVLTPVIGVTRGVVVWQRNGTPTGIAGATVSLHGVISFDFDPITGDLVTSTGTCTTTTDVDGIGEGPDAATDTLALGEFRFDFSQPGVCATPIIFPEGDYVVSAPGFTDGNFPGEAVGQDLTPTPFQLSAMPATLTGNVSLLVGAAPPATVADVHIEVLSGPDPTATYRVEVQPHVIGCCPSFSTTDATWRIAEDGRTTVDPGDYVLRFSVLGGGFATRTVTASVVPPDQHLPQPTVTLEELATIEVHTVQRIDDGTPTTPLNGASLRLLKTDDSGVFQQVEAVTVAGGTNTYTFGNLTPGTYRVQASALHHADGTTADIVVDGGDDASRTIELQRLGSITGTLLGRIGSTDAPLPGVVVTACRDTRAGTCAAATLGVDRFVATTGAGGAFAIEDLGPGTYDLLVGLPGYDGIDPDDAPTTNDASVTVAQGRPAAATYPAGATAGQIVLNAQPAVLFGTVVNDSAQAVPNVTISLTGPTTISELDADGAYEIGGLLAGRYDVRFSAPNHGSVTHPGVQIQPGQRNELRVTLSQQFNTIAGEVTASYGGTVVRPLDNPSGACPCFTLVVTDSATGAVVTGASVLQEEVVEAGAVARVRYQVSGLLDGTYTLTFSKAGYAQDVVQDIAVSGGGVVSRQDAELAALNRQVVATVRSGADDQPAAGMSVTLTAVAGGTGVTQSSSGGTNASGQVTFPSVVPGAYTITASDGPGGHRDDTAGVALTVPPGAAATQVPASFTIVESAISGTVTLRESAGVNATDASGVSVAVKTGGGATAGSATTAADGSYVVYLPSTDASYVVDFTNAGYTDDLGNAADVDPLDVADVDATLDKLGSLTVTVTDGTATKVGGATVTLSPGGGSCITESLAADPDFGMCTIPNLAPGTDAYAASASKAGAGSGGTSGVDVPIGGTGTTTVQLANPGALRVAVTNGATPGAPIVGASVSIDGTALACTTAGATGSCTINGVAPGTYDLTVTAAGHVAGGADDVVVAGGATTDVPVSLAAHSTLTVTVDEGGAAVAGATVTVGSTGTGCTTTGAGGSCTTSPAVAPGTYTVEVTASGGRDGSASCVVPADSTVGACSVTIAP